MRGIEMKESKVGGLHESRSASPLIPQSRIFRNRENAKGSAALGGCGGESTFIRVRQTEGAAAASINGPLHPARTKGASPRLRSKEQELDDFLEAKKRQAQSNGPPTITDALAEDLGKLGVEEVRVTPTGRIILAQPQESRTASGSADGSYTTPNGNTHAMPGGVSFGMRVEGIRSTPLMRRATIRLCERRWPKGSIDLANGTERTFENFKFDDDGTTHDLPAGYFPRSHNVKDEVFHNKRDLLLVLSVSHRLELDDEKEMRTTAGHLLDLIAGDAPSGALETFVRQRLTQKRERQPHVNQPWRDLPPVWTDNDVAQIVDYARSKNWLDYPTTQLFEHVDFAPDKSRPDHEED
jgi:hypothetical protein